MIVELGDVLELQSTTGTAKGGVIPFAVTVCSSPTCGCQRLNIILAEQIAKPDLGIETQPRTEFAIDWSTGAVVSQGELTEPAQRRMKEFLNRARESDIDPLARIFRERKQKVILHGSLDTTSDNWSKSLDLTAMVGIRDIFPLIDLFEFEAEGIRYDVLDCHCLNEGCDCREIVLSFFRIPGQPTKARLESSCEARYNLLNGDLRPEAPGDATLVAMLTPRLLAKYPDLNALLKQRYGRVRQLVAEKPHQRTGSKPALTSGPARCGRNDPCPCGSGKKFKKCCGT